MVENVRERFLREEIAKEGIEEVHTKSAIHEYLMVAKPKFFISAATVMQPYQQKFQTDAPMLLFVTTEIVLLLKNSMQRFIKQCIL